MKAKLAYISIILGVCITVWVFIFSTKGAINNEEVETNVVESQNLKADKAAMWHLVPLKTSGDVTYKVSPVSAINAASRVFESEKKNLIGLSFQEVLKKLNHVESHREGSYNFPFWPLSKDEKAFVFRFDCGSFGWQFDLLYDENEKVTEIRRRWIH